VHGCGNDAGFTVHANSTLVWYTGTPNVLSSKYGPAATHKYLTIGGGLKGVLHVNSINIGRNWTIGPQQSQYPPGAWLKEQNEFAALELEPQYGVNVDGERIGRSAVVQKR
jgi:hypothetical protein